MTGYTVHTGSTEKFAEGWDVIFRKAAAKSKKKPTKPAKSKAPAKKKAKKR